jgi:hypothetical protein
MSGHTVSPLMLSLVAGGFITLGVVLKISYDAVAARHASRHEDTERFAAERKEAFERFYEAIGKQLERAKAMHSLVEAHHQQGKVEMSDQEVATFPGPAMADLVAAQEQIRRLARSFAVIKSADAIVQLFVDIGRCLRGNLEDPGPNDDISWFLLQRFLEDRIDEFVHGYREDLGIGRPAGAPKHWPVVQRDRPFSLDESEAIVRAHIPIKILPNPVDKSPRNG